MLTCDRSVFVSIVHPEVQIDEGADVDALQKRETDGVLSVGGGSKAAEAYRVPGPVRVTPALEGEEHLVCHVMAFPTTGIGGRWEEHARCLPAATINIDQSD
jgi:hypothetical protein